MDAQYGVSGRGHVGSGDRRRTEALAALGSLEEQLEAAQEVVDAARAAWKNDEYFHKLVAALREYESNPAKERT